MISMKGDLIPINKEQLKVPNREEFGTQNFSSAINGKSKQNIESQSTQEAGVIKAQISELKEMAIFLKSKMLNENRNDIDNSIIESTSLSKKFYEEKAEYLRTIAQLNEREYQQKLEITQLREELLQLQDQLSQQQQQQQSLLIASAKFNDRLDNSQEQFELQITALQNDKEELIGKNALMEGQQKRLSSKLAQLNETIEKITVEDTELKKHNESLQMLIRNCSFISKLVYSVVQQPQIQINSIPAAEGIVTIQGRTIIIYDEQSDGRIGLVDERNIFDISELISQESQNLTAKFNFERMLSLKIQFTDILSLRIFEAIIQAHQSKLLAQQLLTNNNNPMIAKSLNNNNSTRPAQHWNEFKPVISPKNHQINQSGNIKNWSDNLTNRSHSSQSPGSNLQQYQSNQRQNHSKESDQPYRRSGNSEKDFTENYGSNNNNGVYQNQSGIAKSVKANSQGPQIDDIVVSIQRASRRASKQQLAGQLYIKPEVNKARSFTPINQQTIQQPQSQQYQLSSPISQQQFQAQPGINAATSGAAATTTQIDEQNDDSLQLQSGHSLFSPSTKKAELQFQEAVLFLKMGMLVLKYSKDGLKPKEKKVELNKNGLYLDWAPPGKVERKQKYILVNDIKKIVLGRESPGFEKFKKQNQKSQNVEDKSFFIICANDRRLELECVDSQARNTFVQFLQIYLKKQNNSYNQQSLIEEL